MSDPFIKIFSICLLYVLLLFVLRICGVGKKIVSDNCNNSCPDCLSPLKRIKRHKADKLLYHLTLRIFNFKRYKCDECAWQGIKWEDKFKL